MAFKTHFRFLLGTIAVLGVLHLAYSFLVMLNFNPSLWVIADSERYLTAMLQRDIPGLLPRDGLFGDGQFTNTVWASSWIFMVLLQVFYHLGGEQVEIGIMLFLGLFFLVGYAVTMYALAVRLLREPWLAAIVVVCSSMALEVSLIGHSFIRAQALFTMLTPLLLLWMLRAWLLPGLNRVPIAPLPVLFFGILVSLTPFLINSTSALGFICFVGGIAGVQWLFGRLPLWTIGVFLVGLIPLVALRVFGGVGVVTAFSDDSLTEMSVALYDVFNATAPLWLLYVLVTVSSGGLVWYFSRRRLPKLIFITAQLYIPMLYFYTGWTPILIWLYGVYRIFKQQDDELDHQLLLTLVVAIWIGPVLQLALYAVWRVTHINLLIGILIEVIRFSRYGYIPQYLLAARAIGTILHDFGGAAPTPAFAKDKPLTFEQSLLLIALGILLLTNTHAPTLPLFPHWVLVLVGAGVLLFCYWQTRYQHIFRRFRRGLLLLVVTLTLSSAIYTTNNVVQFVFQNTTSTTDSYKALINWARDHTPVDSLFHLTTLDESFRFMAQRSLVIAAGDAPRSLYSTRDLAEMNAITTAAAIETSAERLTGFAARYGADYVILTENLPDMLPAIYEDIWYTPELVYQNAHFRVYQVQAAAWLYERPYPLSAEQAAALATFKPDFMLETDTIVLNPMAGDILNYAGVENWLPAYALRDGADPETTFALTHLIHQMQSAQDLAPDVFARWSRNFLPGDLKTANVDYVLVTPQWLQNIGVYGQSLLADITQYQLVTTLISPIDKTEYQLYAVVGDATEKTPPPIIADAMSILPVYATTDDPIIMASPTVWRGLAAQQTFLPATNPLYLILPPENAERESITQPENVVYHLNAASWEQLQDFVGDADRFWYLDVRDIAHTTPFVLDYFRQQGYSADGGRQTTLPNLPDLTFTLYQVQRQPQPALLETLWRFGDNELEVQHIELLQGDTAAPCGTLGIRSWWLNPIVPAQNYFITLRLVNSAGQFIAQSDGRIGEYRSREISANTLYFDERWLNVPCDAVPGEYALVAGLYSYENGTYSDLIPVRDMRDETLVQMAIFGNIEIVP